MKQSNPLSLKFGTFLIIQKKLLRTNFAMLNNTTNLEIQHHIPKGLNLKDHAFSL
jgi:hypothetical protein